MNNQSSVMTGGITLSAATLAPFVSWALSGFPRPIPDSVPYLLAAVILTAGHAVYNIFMARKGEAPPVSPPVDKAQGGFAVLPLLILIAAMVAVLALSGCTTTTGSMYAGLAAQAKAGIQVFDDNTLATMHDLLCAQPYSAIQRHPEMQPGIVALCGPLANTTSLDPAQVMQMLSIAKQLGIAAPVKP